MGSSRIRHGADVFEVQTDRLDVTSNHRPSESWRVTDAHGHEHRWHYQTPAGPVPTTDYHPSRSYVIPTIRFVRTGTGYFEDGEEYPIGHQACRDCGTVVDLSGAHCADAYQQYIPGLRSYLINGEHVSPEEFKRRWEAAQA